MSDASPWLWSCPSCGRRVPRRAAVCHCGMTRDRAMELAASEPAVAATSTSGWRPGVPRDGRLLLAAAALVFAAGLAWAVLGPTSRDRTIPVLGWIDPGPPDAVTLLAEEAGPPARPPFKLPWWK